MFFYIRILNLYILKMNNNLHELNESLNKSIFECRGSNFNEFQKDLMGFMTNYLDQYNKRKFFEINVKLFSKFF